MQRGTHHPLTRRFYRNPRNRFTGGRRILGLHSSRGSGHGGGSAAAGADGVRRAESSWCRRIEFYEMRGLCWCGVFACGPLCYGIGGSAEPALQCRRCSEARDIAPIAGKPLACSTRVQLESFALHALLLALEHIFASTFMVCTMCCSRDALLRIFRRASSEAPH